MTIAFGSIARHLQIQIAEKVSYWDSPELESSSKHGRKIVNLVSNQAAVDIWSVKLTTSVEISISNPDRHYTNTWKLNEFLNLLNGKEQKQRFSVSHIYFYRRPALEEFLQIAETGLFVFNNTYLGWYYEDKVDRTMFTKILEAFRVKKFYLASPRFDSELTGTKQFCELENLNSSYPMKISGDVFLQIRVHTIKLVGLNSDFPIGLILNRMLQQWLQNKREIRRFEIQLYREYESMESETLFSNISHSVLWSKQTHDNSMFSYIPFGEVGHEYDNQVIYLIPSESKKLLVILGTDRFIAFPTTDEKEELAGLLQIKSKIR